MENTVKTILLVEDEVLLAMSEMHQLKKEGYSVIHVDSGEKAVQTMRALSDSIDLILMDIDLGKGIDGTVAAEEILKTYTVPIVFLSSHTEKEVVEKTEKITSYGYVVKNTGITVLNASIKMAFKLFDAHRNLEKHKTDIEMANEELQSVVEEFETTNEQLYESEFKLSKRERQYRLLFENMIAAFALHQMIYDEEGNPVDYLFLDANPAFERLTGISVKSILGKTVKEVLPSTEQYWIDTYGEVAKTGKSISYQNFSAELNRYYDTWVFSPEENQFAVVFTDITSKIKAEHDLKRVNGIYSVISQINQMIVRERDRDRVFKETCRIAQEYGQFKMTWIGLIEDTEGIIRPITWYGKEEGYLTKIKKISTKDIPEGKGPTGMAIREGKTYYCNDIAGDPIMEPWREEALKRDYRSSIAIPIRVNGEVIGAFTLYSSEPFFFGAPEVKLLEEVTGDLGFALEMLEGEKKRKEAEENLIELLSHKEILMKELQHRVKNNLAVIVSLLDLGQEHLSDEKSIKVFEDAKGRIHSMAAVYERLYLSKNLTSVDLHEYVKQLAAYAFNTYNIDSKRIKLILHLEEIFLDPKRAVPLGLILNELITNALKYAYPADRSGEVRVSLSKTDSIISLSVSEDGIGLKEDVDYQNEYHMGFMLIRMLSKQIGAEYFIHNKNGTSITVSFHE